jgi:antitoxin component YwqK of YwqJK toxin-antitoxin module
MIKLTFVICLVVFTAIAYAQSEKEYTFGMDAFEAGTTKTGKTVQDSEGKPITGQMKRYYMLNGKSTGKLWKITSYKNGTAEGLETEYYESGKINIERYYKRENGRA